MEEEVWADAESGMWEQEEGWAESAAQCSVSSSPPWSLLCWGCGCTLPGCNQVEGGQMVELVLEGGPGMRWRQFWRCSTVFWLSGG